MKLTVNGAEVEVPEGVNVLQACEAAGAEVPRFCYHDRLSVAGNCRMCLVDIEINGRLGPKPTASCAFPASEGMAVYTNTDRITKARKGVMEFLLINHPLDCPICDQGGECDLQDQAVAFGMDHSRYQENKRAVSEKYMGPLIKTIMTRCIQCTRCVRFSTEVAGVEEIGLLNRGEHAEISTIEKALDSELSGNLVDVCPVGALTSKPYAFAARPWELRKTQTIDVMDAVGSNIRVDARGRDVLRALPRLHEGINEEWLADKSRHAVDGLRQQRLDRPYVRENGKLRPASWDEALARVATEFGKVNASQTAAIAGDQCDAESLFALKSLMTSLGVKNLDCRQDGSKLGSSPDAGRSAYLFNTSIAGIEQADAILLVGTNPRWEAPLINARIRKRFLSGELTVSGIGAPVDLSYQVNWLGDDASKILDKSAKAALKDAKNPMVIVGSGALTRADGDSILKAAASLVASVGGNREDWNGFNVLHTAASRVAGLDLGFLPDEGALDRDAIVSGHNDGSLKALYLLAADELPLSRNEDCFVVYQGHHGDRGAAVADVILPGAAYTEKNGIYVNTEGRVQMARIAGFPPGDAREDWKILRALSALMGQTLGFDSLSELRTELVKAHPSFGAVDAVPSLGLADLGKAGPIESSAITLPINNYYMTCAISRASKTMADCTQSFVTPKLEAAA